MSARAVTLLIGVVMGSAACRESPQASAADLRSLERTRQRQFESRLAKADANPSRPLPAALWIMPPELREISGLALTADGRLLAHDDEVGRVYVLDPRSGVILKQFTIGTAVRGDFESIAVAGSDIYLLASNGILYQFREGEDGGGVPYSAFDLHLAHECEFESMAFEKDSDWLVMPCKRVMNKQIKDALVIYRWRLQGPESTKLSTVTIPLARLIGGTGWKGFHPSDMTIDPTTGNFVMISSHEKGLIEMTPTGDLVRARPLPSGHNQPEGVAITKDNILIISDESNKAPAAITLYRWHP
jgi:hypothetical protein